MAKQSVAAPDPFANCLVDHHRLVNNTSLYPDVFFTIEDKYEVSAHFFVLKMRLPQLLEDGTGIKKKKQKKKGDTQVFMDLAKDQHITMEAFERVLVYAYCGAINTSTFTPFKAVEVMRAATVFKIPRLLALASKFLQESLTMENIFRLLKFSDSLDVSDAKTICIDFALQSPDFFTSANAEDLGFKLYQEVTALLLKHHQNPDKNKSLMKIDTSAEDTIARDFKHIYGSTEVTSDITFNIKGEDIRAHRAILADQSAEFAAFVGSYEPAGKKATGLVLDEKYAKVSTKAFSSMLRYFYYGEQQIDMNSSCELIPFAKDFKLVKLYALLEKIVGTTDVAMNTCLPVLDVAYNPLMGENPTLQTKLKQDALDFAVNNLEKIDFQNLSNLSPVISSHILQRLQQTVGPNWGLMGISGAVSTQKTPQKKSTVSEDEDASERRSTKKKERKETKRAKKGDEEEKKDDKKEEKKDDKKDERKKIQTSKKKDKKVGSGEGDADTAKEEEDQ